MAAVECGLVFCGTAKLSSTGFDSWYAPIFKPLSKGGEFGAYAEAELSAFEDGLWGQKLSTVAAS